MSLSQLKSDLRARYESGLLRVAREIGSVDPGSAGALEWLRLALAGRAPPAPPDGRAQVFVVLTLALLDEFARGGERRREHRAVVRELIRDLKKPLTKGLV